MKPKYMTQEGMNDGIARLLVAPRDLGLSGAVVIHVSPARGEAPAAYRALFTKYRRELKKALEEAVEWWDYRTRSLQEELGSAKQARVANWAEFPAGPVSDPATVAVIRKYWLACSELNASEVPPVAPEWFLLQWVVDEGDMGTAELLSAMPYWPMGLDGAGRWT
ncbi:hypothetical protein [uncultured Variovorax sp.]|uniref:hypothetical protein n=1 Tax=uncultured Variovorax sp. TaxID=114708 RepID=UPI0025D8B153|nr:hypothetical protein [uncultured Variovorax sp.]